MKFGFKKQTTALITELQKDERKKTKERRRQLLAITIWRQHFQSLIRRLKGENNFIFFSNCKDKFLASPSIILLVLVFILSSRWLAVI